MTGPTPVERSSLGRVLANRNFARLFTAGILSTGGRAIYSLAITWAVFIVTGSALDVAWVAIAQIVGSIVFSLPAGVWVDSFNRKRLMVLSDVVRAGAVGAFAIYTALVGFNLYLVLGITFLVTGFTTIFQPAERAILPMLLGKEDLGHANGLVNSSRYIVQAVANSVGGALVVSVGVVTGLLYNSATFVLSALLVATVIVAVPQALPETGAGSKRRTLSEIREGFRWLLRSGTGLFELTLSSTFLNIFSTIVWTFLVVYATLSIHGDAFTFGVLLASLTVGYGVGSLAVGPTRATRHTGLVWVVFGGMAPGLAVAGVALLPDTWVAFPLIVVFGSTTGFAGVTWLTTAQTIVPSNVQGRYYALDGMISWAAIPAAEVMGALLIDALGINPTFLIAGMGLIATGAVASLNARLRGLRVP
jgi:MFS family permease